MCFRSRAILLVGFILLLPVAAASQQSSTLAEQFRIELKSVVEKIQADKKKGDRALMEQTVREEFGPANIGLFSKALAGLSEEGFFSAVERVRMDKQVGTSGGNSAGSTSVTAKGSVPSILGYAAEHGAIERTENGATITFRGNPVGIATWLAGEGYLKSFSDLDPSTRVLRRFSFGLSFDASRGGSSGVLTGSLRQLSGWSVRFDILNHRDPRGPSFRTQWNELIRGNIVPMTVANSAFHQAMLNDAGIQRFFEQAQQRIIDASPEDVEGIIGQELAVFVRLPFPATVAPAIQSYRSNINAFLSSRGKLLEAAAKGPIVTFEYSATRQVDAPTLSTFNLIAETGLFRGYADLTANATFTIFNSIPAGTSGNRLRDFKISAQVDAPLVPLRNLGNLVISFAGRYERLPNDTTANGGMTTTALKGDIAVGQFKITIPLGDSGFKLPVSFTVANRTELIKEREVRGNFGITFDLDSLFARLKP